ncbi:Fic family protein [Sanguibacter antarcticus]|uniref:Fic family protein n=1 Tax=Sanguibacter antarcticus TaxID=372484 RepID=A0A2A9E536_9MICO|nr:Fic family protein [Sanguibacter antarcticus]PFG33289.1 Fic family protein [Sanguibacter antarcticus]
MNDEPLTIAPLTYESHTWTAENDGMRTRRHMAGASGSYQSSITPPIAGLRLTLPADLAADTEEAAAALAQFNSHARATLGTASPFLGPMSSILLRTESTSSSQIENLTVGARQLALAEIDESAAANAQIVVANVRAMEAALELADRLDTDAILTMHDHLLSGQRGWEEHAGTLRTQLVWIGSSPVTPIGASHVAPQHEHVPAAIDDLVTFMRRDDLPVIAQAAIAHAQFETIHPFVDGNGRTGRALVHAMMRSKGVLTDTTAPISAGLLRDTSGYFDALGSFRDGDARPIVERFAEASRFAARSGAHLVDALAGEMGSSREQMTGLRSDAAGWRVLPHLVAHPVVNAALAKTLLSANDTTAQRALTQLTDAGVLEERTGKSRGRVWQHSGILDVLDDYAKSLHRR